MKKLLISVFMAATLFVFSCTTAIAAQSGTVIGNGVNFRTQPYIGSPVYRSLPLGTALTITGEAQDFYKVEISGQTGYVSKSYVQKGIIHVEPGTVIGSNVNFRTQPNTSAAVLKVLPLGTVVNITGEQPDFYKVAVSGQTGFISKRYVQKGHFTFTSVNSKGIVTASALNVRSGPSGTSSILGSLSNGTQVTVLSKTGNWYRINYRGSSAYVSASYIKLNENSAGPSGGTTASVTGQNIVNYAKQFLGVSYVYGGQSPSGFDCSGLVWYVYKHFGYSLPRTAMNQYTYGTSISKSQLQPGDLVFFETPGNPNPVGHVGIYVGNNSFIHSPSTGGMVKITSLSNSYYMTNYVGAKRIIK